MTPVWLTEVIEFYNQLSHGNVSTLHRLYSPNVQFIDPVHQLSGISDLEHYFLHAYERLSACQFVLCGAAGDEHQGFISWQMNYSHSAIAGGAPQCLMGCSELRRDELHRITYHRDFYDLTELVYQHVPVVNWVTSMIKKRMANHAEVSK